VAPIGSKIGSKIGDILPERSYSIRPMSFRRTILSALATLLMSVGAAFAQIVDVRTVTCNDFIGFKKDTTFAIVMWLDAYYRDEEDAPIIDFQKMRQKASRLTVYCSQNPTHSLTTAAEPIMGAK
jgi:HdeA/HdeB family protein